ncbi:MAG: glycosyltransferase family 2 protein [Synechococcaceae cyanobacterium]
MTRLVVREPELLSKGAKWFWDVLKRHPASTGGRPWVLTDPGLRGQDYREWLEAMAAAAARERKQAKQWLQEQVQPPQISILLTICGSNPHWLHEAIVSVRQQTYPLWQLCIAWDQPPEAATATLLTRFAQRDARIRLQAKAEEQLSSIPYGSRLNKALSLASGDWLACLGAQDRLSPDALMWVARTIVAEPQAQLLFSDEDKISISGKRHDPYFKSAWNPSLQEGQNMLGRLSVYNTELVHRVGGFRGGYEGAEDYDLALRCSREIRMNQVIHIPRILYHMRVDGRAGLAAFSLNRQAQDSACRALQDQLSSSGIRAEIEITPAGLRAHLPVPADAPLVSIVVPTRNRIEVLKPCLKSILEGTDYPRLELLVVDNNTDDPATLAYLECLGHDHRVTVLRDRREFNYSALNNAAVERAKGQLVLLLNNDVEAVEPGWLREMVAQLARPGVAAVGAKLLFPNRRIQHAGIILGMGGVAAHGHRDREAHDAGYFGRTALVQDLSAVTGACMLVWRHLYLQLGGLDEQLAVAFNDVDFCLRLRSAGWRIVYTPFACLIHHESVTRGAENADSPRFQAEVRLMMQRWQTCLQADPAYSPHLSLTRTDFSLPWPPRRFPNHRGPDLGPIGK